MRLTSQRGQNQLTFIPWLINEINTNHHPGLQWIDVSQHIASIPWPRARDTLPLEELGVIYCWHKYRYPTNFNQSRSPSTLKGTFRAIINSRDEITKLREENNTIIIRINQCATATSPSFERVSRVHTSSSQSSHGNQPFSMSPWNGEQPPQYDMESAQRAHTSSSQSCHSNTQQSPWNGSMSPLSWDEGPYEVVTAPSWAQQILNEEQNSGPTCNVYISVYSRNRFLCDKQVDLQKKLLIYSDPREIDFSNLSEEQCDKMYGKGSKHADKLNIPKFFCQQMDGNQPFYVDQECEQALQNFKQGILLSTDFCYNILAQRLCAVRPYFGHSNHGGATQMPRPKDKNRVVNPIFSYISFLEMAGYLIHMRSVKKPTNESDRPTAVTYIAIGQEWTPTRPIQDLPLLIEIQHGRAMTFKRTNLPEDQVSSQNAAPGSGIVISITNSNSTGYDNGNKAFTFTDQMMSDINEEILEPGICINPSLQDFTLCDLMTDEDTR